MYVHDHHVMTICHSKEHYIVLFNVLFILPSELLSPFIYSLQKYIPDYSKSVEIVILVKKPHLMHIQKIIIVLYRFQM